MILAIPLLAVAVILGAYAQLLLFALAFLIAAGIYVRDISLTIRRRRQLRRDFPRATTRGG